MPLKLIKHEVNKKHNTLIFTIQKSSFGGLFKTVFKTAQTLQTYQLNNHIVWVLLPEFKELGPLDPINQFCNQEFNRLIYEGIYTTPAD